MKMKNSHYEHYKLVLVHIDNVADLGWGKGNQAQKMIQNTHRDLEVGRAPSLHLLELPLGILSRPT